jgi:hypothetical protein
MGYIQFLARNVFKTLAKIKPPKNIGNLNTDKK